MRAIGCVGRVGCLIALLILVVVAIFFWQGGFDFLGDFGIGGGQPTAPTSSNGVGPNASSQLVFRFVWQGNQIFYNGNLIDEERFAEIVKEAKTLDGRVECEKATDVTVELAERRRAILTEVGVPYQGC
jgi:hypothetical protein